MLLENSRDHEETFLRIFTFHLCLPARYPELVGEWVLIQQRRSRRIPTPPQQYISLCWGGAVLPYPDFCSSLQDHGRVGWSSGQRSLDVVHDNLALLALA